MLSLGNEIILDLPWTIIEFPDLENFLDVLINSEWTVRRPPPGHPMRATFRRDWTLQLTFFTPVCDSTDPDAVSLSLVDFGAGRLIGGRYRCTAEAASTMTCALKHTPTRTNRQEIGASRETDGTCLAICNTYCLLKCTQVGLDFDFVLFLLVLSKFQDIGTT